MKATFLEVGVVLSSFAIGIASAQESPYVLNRSRVVSLSTEAAWKNCVALVQAAPVIVNTIDSNARLVTFTLPLGTPDAKVLVLDAKDVEKQPLTIHVTIWIQEAGPGARMYVRAAPSGGGFFSHSNGLIEQRILDAIEKGETWMHSAADPSPKPTLDTLPRQAEEAAVAFATSSKQIVLNTSSSDLNVVTISFMIRNADFAKYVSKMGKSYYPGIAHMTFWFQPVGSETTVMTRTLIFESGSLSPLPLTSNGQLESAILDDIRKRLAGAADAPFTIGSDYRGKPEFWNVLFGIDAVSNNSDAPHSLTRDLPVTIDKAWNAGLHVITQSKIIVDSDRSAGTFEYLTAHTSQIGTKYAVHRVIVRFVSTDFGTQMTIVIPHTQETAEESENDMKLCSEQIGTELFLKDRLKWLTEKKGSN